MDEGDASLDAHQPQCHPDKSRQVRFSLDRGLGLFRPRRGRGTGREKRRVRHDMIEGVGGEQAFLQHIALPDHHSSGKVIGDDILLAYADELGLTLDPLDFAGSDTPGEAETRRADAATEIEDGFLLFLSRRHRGREKHRIDRHAITLWELAQLHLPAQQGIGTHLPSSISSSKARAAWWSASATMRRRGIAPILPSSTLVWVSNTTTLMPDAARSACSQERRTGSLLRMSSFTGLTPSAGNLCSPAIGVASRWGFFWHRLSTRRSWRRDDRRGWTV